MKYRYNIHDGVTRIKTNTKKYVLSGLAIVFMVGGLSVPALAMGKSESKAAGDVGYTAYGLQRNAKFEVGQESKHCKQSEDNDHHSESEKIKGNYQFTSGTQTRVEKHEHDSDRHRNNCICEASWNITGNYNIAFNLTGDPTQYVYDTTLTQTGSSLGGSGGYPTGGTHTYEWSLTSGTVSGSNVSFSAKYTLGIDATSPLTTMNVTGIIALDGSMSGTWTDNYQGAPRTGEWHTTSGTATQTVIGCNGEGSFKYSDVDGNWYKVKVEYVSFNGNDTWFAGPVTSGNVGAGQWLFAKVHDGGTPGSNGDQISGSFTNENTAKLGVALMTDPSDGPFAITSGNLVVYN